MSKKHKTFPSRLAMPNKLERMFARIRKTESCWVWLPKGFNHGYGQFRREDGTIMLAHRAVYEALVGTIPEGLVIHHICNNPKCVNPEHLKPVTQRENIMASETAICAKHSRKTHCKHGHLLGGNNLYIAPSTVERRTCKTCKNKQNREYKLRLKGAYLG